MYVGKIIMLYFKYFGVVVEPSAPFKVLDVEMLLKNRGLILHQG